MESVKLLMLGLGTSACMGVEVCRTSLFGLVAVCIEFDVFSTGLFTVLSLPLIRKRELV